VKFMEMGMGDRFTKDKRVCIDDIICVWMNYICIYVHTMPQCAYVSIAIPLPEEGNDDKKCKTIHIMIQSKQEEKKVHSKNHFTPIPESPVVCRL